jgi:hypothetical protein
MQIVHAIDSRQAPAEVVERYRRLGLGGLVTNVSFKDYLESEEGWKRLADVVEACRQKGMVVWIYDEHGYPSGSAGGLVLKKNPAFEAQSLVFDAARPDPLYVRPAFEHTHASNNYADTRRYINLLDDAAVACFVETTHAAYWRHLEPYFGNTIQAFFTDEPSLIAINLGQLAEKVRTKVHVSDAIDPNVPALASVPWTRDLAEQYRRRYGEDLTPSRKSLFAGDTDADRRTRRQFWGLVGQLVADRYFGQIQRWCATRHVASSGHALAEEDLLRHVPLDGNALKALGLMDIPGLDLLTSNPEVVIYGGWMTAGMPYSAALLNGRRRVMTEVSDFSQRMADKGPASLAEMQATAAWQAAWGVTEFTLYYKPDDRSADEYRRYCQYVGRLNAVLKPAQPVPEVLLYYPVYDLWSEYRPVAEPLRIKSQSPRARSIVSSFIERGQMLQRSQIPFALADHEQLSAAAIDPKGAIRIGQHKFSALVLPDLVQLPDNAARNVERFRAAGGCVVQGKLPAAKTRDGSWVAKIDAPYQIAPASQKIALARFVRDGRPVLLLANVGREAYQGSLSVPTAASWVAMNPDSGAISVFNRSSAGTLPLKLGPHEALLLVGRP